MKKYLGAALIVGMLAAFESTVAAPQDPNKKQNEDFMRLHPLETMEIIDQDGNPIPDELYEDFYGDYYIFHHNLDMLFNIFLAHK